ncbi:uncharacterized protein I206_103339 [Kwoniella pini CBS 10737]|uniref:RRM domain-containing protein n=1 Tax=Kwoniella pini CBS 10737 TaxID=1296096 RepID=A0A1B9I9Y8_9TREE|nr:uncharacterized protein I206_01655 [Kwoniella pini CBS 10737]OCF52366.1 hypothetical protein I206_01655 [Kwoniella pini CBS 10737]
MTSTEPTLPYDRPMRQHRSRGTPRVSQDPGITAPHKRMFSLPPHIKEIDAVVVHDLVWWTKDQAIVDLAKQLGFDISVNDVQFQEHKVNGKSKGSAFIICHTRENALTLFNFFQANTFLGRKIPVALGSTILGNPLLPGWGNLGPRPLSTAIHTTVRTPTNSHGGVNFNRVRPSSRSAIQSNLGVGHPYPRASRTSNWDNPPGLGNTEFAMAWPSQEGMPPGYGPIPLPYQYNGHQY